MKPSGSKPFGVTLESKYPHSDYKNAQRVAKVYGASNLKDRIKNVVKEKDNVASISFREVFIAVGSSAVIMVYVPNQEEAQETQAVATTTELSHDDSLDLMAALERQSNASIWQNVRHPLAAIGAISMRYGFNS